MRRTSVAFLQQRVLITFLGTWSRFGRHTRIPLSIIRFSQERWGKEKIQNDTSQWKRKIARTCKILSKFSKSTRRSTRKLRGPQSRVLFFFFTSNPDRYVAQKIHDICSLNLSSRCVAIDDPKWRFDLVSGIPIGRSWSWDIGQSSEFSSEIVDRSMRLH